MSEAYDNGSRVHSRQETAAAREYQASVRLGLDGGDKRNITLREARAELAAKAKAQADAQKRADARQKEIDKMLEAFKNAKPAHEDGRGIQGDNVQVKNPAPAVPDFAPVTDQKVQYHIPPERKGMMLHVTDCDGNEFDIEVFNFKYKAV